MFFACRFVPGSTTSRSLTRNLFFSCFVSFVVYVDRNLCNRYIFDFYFIFLAFSLTRGLVFRVLYRDFHRVDRRAVYVVHTHYTHYTYIDYFSGCCSLTHKTHIPVSAAASRYRKCLLLLNSLFCVCVYGHIMPAYTASKNMAKVVGKMSEKNFVKVQSEIVQVENIDK